MPIELQPKVKRSIGFVSDGIYYLDLDGANTLVVYDKDHHKVYDNNLSHYRYVYALYGKLTNIYIEE